MSKTLSLKFIPVILLALLVPFGARAGTILADLTANPPPAVDATTFFRDLRWYLNTDSGHVYSQYSNYPWEDRGPDIGGGNRGPVGQVATQADGSEVMVFHFSNMRVTVALDIIGSRPAVVMSPGNIVIDAPVVVSAGGKNGATGASTTIYRDVGGASTAFPGPHGAGAQGATGGGGGAGAGGVCLVTYYPWGWDGAMAGGGGGGGSFSVGESGQTGHLVACTDGRSLQYAGGLGGAARNTWATLSGGGGGGAGGTGTNWGGWPVVGGSGGNGGGAILFAASGDFTIGANGSIRADGANAPYVDAGLFEASGGGGAGGFVAFNIGGRWHNNGLVSARGGAGSWGGLFHPGATAPASPRDQMGGVGSGGYVAINPTVIINTGAIDVSGGNLAAAPNYGGAALLDAPAIFSTAQIAGSKNTNATATVVASTTVPGAPNIGTATPANGSATVNFAGPDSNGGSAITGFTVTSSPGGLTVSASASPITVTGLTNGTAYTFTVSATNANGSSSASVASNSVTPSTGPGTPTIGTATPGNASATVAFTAPADDGGSPITSYSVTASSSYAYYNQTATAAQSPITVTGLVNGQAYTFTVTATNANGTSSASSPSNSVTPATVPGTPTVQSVAPGNASAAVQFLTPSANGAAITGYTASCAIDGGSPVTATGAGSPITVTGLTNGAAYTCWLTATNAAGASAPSAAVTTTPRTVPGAPIIGTATFGDGQATITFTAPSDNGGSSITGYTVTSTPDNRVGFGTGSPITVSGLTNGTPYTFKVTASNAAGSGSASAASNSILSLGAPGAPAVTQVDQAENIMTISFNAPANDGGSPVTGYTASCGGLTAGASASPITITGLIGGMTYACSVRATNANGTGAGSTAWSITGLQPTLSITSSGWHLVANSVNGTLDVAAAFGDAEKVNTVWKWNAALSKWAFYTPALSGSALTDYAASKGYDLLTEINAGEGFWVNAKQFFAIQLPAGTNVVATDFASGGTKALGTGWSLIGVGEARTPSQFNAALGVNLTTLWAWDNGISRWYFYAPSLDASGGLPAYISSKSYLDFGINNKTLGQGEGFWVNKP